MKTRTNGKTATTAANGKVNSCVCGCGTKVSGLFAQGHDQRVRGMLVRGELNATLRKAIAAGLLLKAVAHANARIVSAKAGA